LAGLFFLGVEKQFKFIGPVDNFFCFFFEFKPCLVLADLRKSR
jgi:hypothetical protein